MKTPKELESFFENKGSAYFSADIIVSELNKEEFPPIEIDKVASNVTDFKAFVGVESICELPTNNLLLLYNEGSYFYVVDTSNTDFSVYYVTHEAYEEFDVFLVNLKFTDFFSQLEEIDSQPAWLTDENAYVTVYTGESKLPKPFNRIFFDRETKLPGLFACVLEQIIDGVELRDKPPYIEVFSSCLNDKEIQKFFTEWLEMSERAKLAGIGINDYGVFVPPNEQTAILLNLAGYKL